MEEKDKNKQILIYQPTEAEAKALTILLKEIFFSISTLRLEEKIAIIEGLKKMIEVQDGIKIISSGMTKDQLW